MLQPFIQKQVGWLKCVACSDSKLRPGHMWIGGNNWIVCPECNGTSQVAKYQLYDPLTGKEINHERHIT
jgi:hypothetical protein